MTIRVRKFGASQHGAIDATGDKIRLTSMAYDPPSANIRHPARP
jgi:hypothetical protein